VQIVSVHALHASTLGLISFPWSTHHIRSPTSLPLDGRQALLAAGLLQALPFKPRTVGFLGVLASAMNCYMLLPAYPSKPAQAGTAPAKAKDA
jgi:hypothetical protein